MITAVDGVVIPIGDARVILAALDLQEHLLAEQRGPHGEAKPERLPPNVRILTLQLRRAIARSGVYDASASTSKLPAQRIGARNSSARNPLLQRDSVHDGPHATLNSAQAAAALGITPNGVRDLHRRGCLHAERVGGRLRFNADEVIARATDKE